MSNAPADPASAERWYRRRLGDRDLTQGSALVTGGAGFIGSHLVAELVRRGLAVTVIDDLSTGSLANLDSPADRPTLRIVVASCADPTVVDREVGRHEIVFHLASTVGVDLVLADPVRTIDTIYRTSATVLDACARHGRPTVVASSSEVYGPSTEVPFREDASTMIGPTDRLRWSYGAAKALVEFLALAHHRDAGLPVCVARLFNTSGPRQNGEHGMVLPTFVTQALRGDPVTVHGDGAQRRCFSSVTDIVDALIRAAYTPAAWGTVINLGSTEEVTIATLAEKVISITGSASPIELVAHRVVRGPDFDDLPRRVPDLTRARDLLDWSPSTSLDEIIASVAQDEIRRLDAPAESPSPHRLDEL